MADINDPGPLDWRVSIVDKSGRPSPEFQRRWNTNRNNTAQIGSISFGNGPPTSTPTDGSQYADTSTNPYTLYIGENGNWNLTTPQAANPTAVAGPAAINGSATTFMRSDAAPAIQKATTSQFGIVKPDGVTVDVSAGVISVPIATTTSKGIVEPDGTTITISGGVISAVGGGGGGSAPTIRGTGIQASSASSYTISWPTGTLAGDLAIVFTGSGYQTSSTPSGWLTLNSITASQWNGSVFAKVLTSADIAAGSVTVNMQGPYDSVLAIVTFVGATSLVSGTNGIQSLYSTASQGISPTSVVSGSMLLQFASNRAANAPTFDVGTILNTINDGANASGTLGHVTYPGATPFGGFTATYPGGNSGCYTSVVSVLGP